MCARVIDEVILWVTLPPGDEVGTTPEHKADVCPAWIYQCSGSHVQNVNLGQPQTVLHPQLTF